MLYTYHVCGYRVEDYKMHTQESINGVFWVRSWVGVGVLNPIWIMKMR